MDAKGENSLALLPERMCIESERKRRRSDMCDIPHDVVIEILTRLPGKSVMRFKFVSKQWSSFISSRYFGNRFLMVTRKRQEPRLYISLREKKKEMFKQGVLLASASLDNNCFVIDQDLIIPCMGGICLNVFRGLMCLYVRKKMCIYNPTTRQFLTLPDIKYEIIAEQGQKKSIWCYIGHDPVSDQYKLFCTFVIRSASFYNTKSEHWVFVLEAQGSWKKVVPLGNYVPHLPFSSLGRTMDGSVVHYTALTDMLTYVVVRFDIRSEELITIPVPEEVRDAVEVNVDLIEYDGKIAIFDYSYIEDKGLVDLWVLKEAGKEEWSKKKTLVLQPCQRHLVDDDFELVVRGTTQDGKVILAPWS